LALVRGLLKVWDATTGKELRLGEVPVRGGTLALSPDGRRLATTTDGAVKIWDARTGQEILTLRGPRLNGILVFSQDGNSLVLGGPGPARAVVIWKATPRAAGARAGKQPIPTKSNGT
jgi:WD40 repeat protein